MSNINNINLFFEQALKPAEIKLMSQMTQSFNKDKNMEFEVAIKGIGSSDRINFIKKYKSLTSQKNRSVNLSLDVNIEIKKGVTFRMTMSGKLLQSFFNDIMTVPDSKIVDYLNDVIHKKPEGLSLMIKDRSSDMYFRSDELTCSVKASKETVDIKIPKIEYTHKMIFRYKDRVTFSFEDYQIDITEVRQTHNIKKIMIERPLHEFEIEFTNHKLTLAGVYKIIYDTYTFINDSQIPITKSEYDNVMAQYTRLMNTNNRTHLYARKSISIEAHHITKFVPNNYGVTDKADGDRHFMLILESGVYLLSYNLVLKKTDLKVDKKYINTILDGELVSKPFSFWVFDMVVYQNSNNTNNSSYGLTKRIGIINDIVKNYFGTYVEFKDYSSINNDMILSKILSHYEKNLKTYWKTVNADIKKAGSLYVNRKLQFIPYGIHTSEVFMYANMIWKNYVYQNLTPYTLDGIIYTPINKPYNILTDHTTFDTSPLEYKWKKPEHNTIDFFIKIIKDEHGDPIIYEKPTSNILYVTARLMVGVTKPGSDEKPVPFKINNVDQITYITVTDDAPRDIEGTVITTNTVVEFMYDFKHEDGFRWVPVRTRYDKTESVSQGKGRYGNPLRIALRVWNTITKPITEDMIAALGNEKTYDKELMSISSMSHPKKNAYYPKKTLLAKEMRAFHNYIKSGMISTYAKKGGKAIDVGCGRGGDMLKLISAEVGELVCTDVDHDGLFTISDSAVQRYTNAKLRGMKVPPVHFINADARGVYNGSVQKNILRNMTDTNAELIDKYLSGKYKYDLINCQFTLHYYMSDNKSWETFMKNISGLAASGANILITCFDGDKVFDMLKNKDNIEIYYDNEDGQKVTMFDIKKMYDDSTKPGTVGTAINVYNSTISEEGVYMKEYLVFNSVMTETMKRYGFDLVEAESFENVYKKHETYFTNPETKPNLPWYENINTFYNVVKNGYSSNKIPSQIGEILSSYKYSMLNKYYVFKCKKISDNPSRVIGVNGQVNLSTALTPYFIRYNLHIDKSKMSERANNLFSSMKKNDIVKDPTVYLIRHNIDDIYGLTSNKLEYVVLRKTRDNMSTKSTIIYKSPDGYFYPIYDGNTSSYEFDDDNVEKNMMFFTNMTRMLNH